MHKALTFTFVYAITLVLAMWVGGTFSNTDLPTTKPVEPVPSNPPVAPVIKGPYEVTNQVPTRFMPYTEVVQWMKQWNEETSDITAFGTYGKNRRGTDLHYLRIGTPGKPRILIHACIHGNERLAAACTLGIMGKMLHDYRRDDEVTWLIDNREIFFVPVFSPESYLRSRHIEEGDPNRRWAYPGSNTNNNSSPIQAMQKWFLEMGFVGAIDGHTFGRDFFWPSIARGDDRVLMRQLAIEMSDLANYDPSAINNRPAGYAIDWYYWKGACSILTEFGNGPSHEMPVSRIQPECERTYKSYLHFIKKAPEIQLQLSGPVVKSTVESGRSSPTTAGVRLVRKRGKFFQKSP